MSFDINTAVPVDSKSGFNINTAVPVDSKSGFNINTAVPVDSTNNGARSTLIPQLQSQYENNQLTPEQVDDYKSKGYIVSKANTLGHNLVQGVTFSLADEIKGFANSVLEANSKKYLSDYQQSQNPNTPVDNLLTPQQLSDAYTSARDAERAQLHAGEQANPKTALLGQVVGGMAVPGLGGLNSVKAAMQGASLAKKAAILSKIGAAEGAVYGFGAGEGKLADQATSTALGAAGGAVLAPVLGTVVPTVASKAYHSIDEALAKRTTDKALNLLDERTNNFIQDASEKLHAQDTKPTDLGISYSTQQLDDALRTKSDIGEKVRSSYEQYIAPVEHIDQLRGRVADQLRAGGHTVDNTTDLDQIISKWYTPKQLQQITSGKHLLDSEPTQAYTDFVLKNNDYIPKKYNKEQLDQYISKVGDKTYKNENIQSVDDLIRARPYDKKLLSNENALQVAKGAIGFKSNIANHIADVVSNVAANPTNGLTNKPMRDLSFNDISSFVSSLVNAKNIIPTIAKAGLVKVIGGPKAATVLALNSARKIYLKHGAEKLANIGANLKKLDVEGYRGPNADTFRKRLNIAKSDKQMQDLGFGILHMQELQHSPSYRDWVKSKNVKSNVTLEPKTDNVERATAKYRNTQQGKSIVEGIKAKQAQQQVTSVPTKAQINEAKKINDLKVKRENVDSNAKRLKNLNDYVDFKPSEYSDTNVAVGRSLLQDKKLIKPISGVKIKTKEKYLLNEINKLKQSDTVHSDNVSNELGHIVEQVKQNQQQFPSIHRHLFGQTKGVPVKKDNVHIKGTKTTLSPDAKRNQIDEVTGVEMKFLNNEVPKNTAPDDNGRDVFKMHIKNNARKTYDASRFTKQNTPVEPTHSTNNDDNTILGEVRNQEQIAKNKKQDGDEILQLVRDKRLTQSARDKMDFARQLIETNNRLVQNVPGFPRDKMSSTHFDDRFDEMRANPTREVPGHIQIIEDAYKQYKGKYTYPELTVAAILNHNNLSNKKLLDSYIEYRPEIVALRNSDYQVKNDLKTYSTNFLLKYLKSKQYRDGMSVKDYYLHLKK